ncbi:MAG TPA: (d)CMP kinase [Casimicrobiaceae bacterium]|nr:(d)CMP kinase [Casimicrobiaceae bacterium]
MMPTEPAGPPPVIAIDGPAASGKGTIAKAVAGALGYRYLESGALYRLVALEASSQKVDADDAPRLAALGDGLRLSFDGERIFLCGQDVSEAIRTEDVSRQASRIAVIPRLRIALLSRQRAFRGPPGLVAEGRDMGTVVFPDAKLKLYLTASAVARAGRRYKQLIDKGNSTTIESLLRDIQDRDGRDSARARAPLKVAAEAIVVDTTELGPDAVVALVLQQYQALMSGGSAGVDGT